MRCVMATTTLIFPSNPFAATDTSYQLQQPARIDDTRNSVASFSPGAAQTQAGAGIGAADDLFDSEDSAGDPYSESGSYVGTQLSVYA